MDLRVRAVAAVQAGMSRREVVAVLGISMATLERWMQRHKAEGHVQPRPIQGMPRRIGVQVEAVLQAQLRAHADATLDEHRALWHQAQGQTLSRATMARAILRVGYTRKKRA